MDGNPVRSALCPCAGAVFLAGAACSPSMQATPACQHAAAGAPRWHPGEPRCQPPAAATQTGRAGPELPPAGRRCRWGPPPPPERQRTGSGDSWRHGEGQGASVGGEGTPPYSSVRQSFERASCSMRRSVRGAACGSRGLHRIRGPPTLHVPPRSLLCQPLRRRLLRSCMASKKHTGIGCGYACST